MSEGSKKIRKSLLSIEVRIKEYIEKLNGSYKIKCPDKIETFSDGSIVNQFWNVYKERIIDEVKNNPNYSAGYEVVHQKIDLYLKRREKRSVLSIEEKVSEYIEKLNSYYDVRANDHDETFSDGSLVNQFWGKNQNKVMMELANNPKYQIGYEKAREKIRLYLERKAKITSLTIDDRVREYIDKLNGDYEIKSNDLEEFFSNGNPVKNFWYMNYTKVIKELKSNPRYNEGYEMAHKKVDLFLKSLDAKTVLSVDERIVEYIEKLNDNYVIKSVDEKGTFSDGSLIGRFFAVYNERIIEKLFNDVRYKNGYEKAIKKINIYKEESYQRKNFTVKDKIAEYIEKINGDYEIKSNDPNEFFSNGDPVNHFWNSRYKRIIEEMNSNPKYKNGYEVAFSKVEAYLGYLRKKENRKKIRDLFLSYGFNCNREKSILDKSYDEIYAKISYLNDNGVSIVIDGKLHCIFFMADINMQVVYNVSLEELVDKYLVDSEQKLESNSKVLKK